MKVSANPQPTSLSTHILHPCSVIPLNLPHTPCMGHTVTMMWRFGHPTCLQQRESYRKRAGMRLPMIQEVEIKGEGLRRRKESLSVSSLSMFHCHRWSFLPLPVTGDSKQNWKHVIRPNPASSEECKTRNVLWGSLD